MSNFQLYTGDPRTYTSLDLTVSNGDVVDFGVLPVPNDGRWTSHAGPATKTFDNTTIAQNNAGRRSGYAGRFQARIGELLGRLAHADTDPFVSTTVAGDTPAVTSGSAATVTSQVFGVQAGQVTEVGSRGVWDTTFGRLPVDGKSGLDFYLTGDTVEIHALPAITGSTPLWIFVDGVPVTAAPSSIATTASVDCYLKLVFPSAARRRVEVFFPHSGSWYDIRIPYAGTLQPAPRKPVVAFIGDSFWGGNNGTPLMQSGDFLLSRLLGVECYSNSLGGTGYVSAGAFVPYGDPTRVAAVAKGQPDLIVIQGSLNDDGLAGIQAAAAACFTALGNALPDVPIIVFGPQPSNGVDTISANRAANIAAVAAACADAPNVLGFHDLVGSAGGVPPAAQTFQTYPDGTLVTGIGSVWKISNGGAAWQNGPVTPGTDPHFALVTAVYTGTGQVGTLKGDGNRDTLLYSDGTHPMPAASQAFADIEVALIRSDLLSNGL